MSKKPKTSQEKLRTLADWLDALDQNRGTTNDEVQVDLRDIADRIDEVLNHIATYSFIDGSDHKQWLIDQILMNLTGDGYNDWVKDYENTESDDEDEWDEWDEGVAP